MYKYVRSFDIALCKNINGELKFDNNSNTIMMYNEKNNQWEYIVYETIFEKRKRIISNLLSEK